MKSFNPIKVAMAALTIEELRHLHNEVQVKETELKHFAIRIQNRIERMEKAAPKKLSVNIPVDFQRWN